MKKYLLLLLTLLLAFTLVFTLASCGGDEGDGDDGDDDGQTEGGGNEGGGNEGGDEPVSPPTADELAALPFNDKTVTYNGSAHSVTVGGSKPSGVTVQYEGNEKVDAGEYTVTAKFYYNNEYVEGADRIAKLTINKADYDMSGVTFTAKSKTYDGQAMIPSISGTLPSGVSVEYDTDGKELVNAGTYTVIAKFTGDANHNPISPVSADFVINKIKFDTSGKLKGKSVSFDGKYHSITATDVPDYVTVSYDIEKVRAIGTHTVTATFTADPVNIEIAVPTRKANLIISKGSYSTSKLTYEELGDGTYAVTGYTGDDDFIVIPDTYNGGSVVSVKSSAFEGDAVGYVYIPNSVTNIGNKAFKDCTSLTEIRLSNALATIGAQAFANVGLTDFKVPASVTTIAQGAFKGAKLESITLTFVGGSANSSNEYLGYIFGGSNADAVPSTLKKIVFADECKAIPAYAFNGCKYIEQFVIGKNVVTLGSSAFAGCSSLHSIYLPETLTTILANTEWANSPFAGCAEDLMIVMEGDINLGFGAYWSNITKDDIALVIYNKEYDDYLENGESFRDVDLTDATLSAIYLNGKVISGFGANVLEYSQAADINKGYSAVRANPSSAAARVVIDAPTVANGGIATITVTSGDKNTVKVYKVKFDTLTGTLNTNNKVVNKDGADATVSFVIDDGQRTNFHKTMLQKYSKLSLTFAIWTKDFATLTETDDKTGYVMNGDKYTYTQTDAQKNNVAFWNDVLLLGRSEIVSHTHTHAFWGTNDDGGTFEYVKNNEEVISTATLPKGSSSKEVYASKQIIEEIFGANSHLGQNAKNLVIVNAGIGVRTSNFTVGGKVIPTYLTYYNSLMTKAMSDGDYIGGRGTFQVTTPEASKSKVTTPAMMKDANYRRSINAYMIVTENRNSGGHWSEGGIDNWTAYIDHAIEQNGLAAYCIHNIIPNPTSHSGHNISEADAEELYAYAANKNVWIATFTDAMMYYSEWSTAKVNSVYVDEKVKVTLTDSERNDVYNMALTVKVNVPFNWESAKVGNDTLEVHRAEDGSAYVYVNIVPDSGTVELTKG